MEATRSALSVQCPGKPPVSGVILQSVLTCPPCGRAEGDTMPADTCQFFYDCKHYAAQLKSKSGDCCVFRPYGTVKWPPIQQSRPCCQD